jgi:hypothetical protein
MSEGDTLEMLVLICRCNQKCCHSIIMLHEQKQLNVLWPIVTLLTEEESSFG